MNEIFAVKFRDGVSPDVAEALIESYRRRGAVFEAVSDRDGRYDVTFPGRTVAAGLSIINTLANEPEIEFATPAFIRLVPNPGSARRNNRTPDGGGGPVLTFSPPAPCSNASTTVPNDSYYCHQWALQKIGAPSAWLETKGLGPSPIIVAVLDDGVEETHPDLSGKIAQPSFDAVGNQNNQVPNYYDYHGTAVAGVIAAATNNGFGVAGVSWGARILPIRIAWTTSASSHWVLDDLVLERALKKAVMRGARVINSSWSELAEPGGPTFPAFTTEVNNAVAQNVVMVFSAGNDQNDPIAWPASLAQTKSVIAVSATTKTDGFHATSNSGEAVSLAAPGQDVFTTDLLGMRGWYDFDYMWGSGFGETSAAAAYVSGAAALLVHKYPAASPAAIKDWLQRGADDLGAPGRDDEFGHGRLDIHGALEVASSIYLSLQLNGICWPVATAKTALATVRQGGPLGPPLAGIAVSFSVTRRNFSVAQATVTTDASGQASITVTAACPVGLRSPYPVVKVTALGRTVQRTW
jgi:hypothetical protein